jgi:hypothetical protein
VALPSDWRWHWLPDGRVAVIEQFSDGWHVIVERSTVAVADSKAAALTFANNLKDAR